VASETTPPLTNHADTVARKGDGGGAVIWFMPPFVIA
jgi:hypothetical protein